MQKLIDTLDEQQAKRQKIAERFAVSATAINTAVQKGGRVNVELNDGELANPAVVKSRTQQSFALKFSLMCQLVRAMTPGLYFNHMVIDRSDSTPQERGKAQEQIAQTRDMLSVFKAMATDDITRSGVRGYNDIYMYVELEEACEYAPENLAEAYHDPNICFDFMVKQVAAYTALCENLTDLLAMRVEAVAYAGEYTDEDDKLLTKIGGEYQMFLNNAEIMSQGLRQMLVVSQGAYINADAASGGVKAPTHHVDAPPPGTPARKLN